LQKAGWIEGKNIGVDYRFGGGDPAKINASAAELVALAPELIYVTGDPPARALHQKTRNFAVACDHTVLRAARCCRFGILQPFRCPAAIEICPLVASKHYDLQSLGCAIQNPLHLLKSPIVGVDESIIENDR
jgi:hypothetical protein